MDYYKDAKAVSASYAKKNFLQILFVFILISSFSYRLIAQNNKTFTIGSISAEPGKKVSGNLIVEDGIDKGTFIPLTIINGINSGPVLTLNAGMHGTEYVPVIVLQKLVEEISPDKLSGTLILVHIANMPAFNGRAVYTSPVDHKNINRSFPGKKDGTVSERIAYTLTNVVLSNSDYYIDLHGGEFNERIVDYIYYCSGSPESGLCKKSKEMALAMGNKYLIPYKYLQLPDSVPSEYSEQEAFRQGAASISLEWGDRGIVKQEEIESAINGTINVMKSIRMLEGTPSMNSNPIYLLNEKSIKSNYDGILYTFVDRAQYVAKGTLIGYTTDYWGNVLEEYHSPVTGIIVVVKISPAIHKGEGVYRIAEPVAEYNE